jgi:hypothetical protein
MKIKNTVSNYMILLFSALLISMTVSLDAGGVPRIAKGIVFDDTNHNRVLDKDEKGIPGIVVSNQYQVVKTDEKGFFSLFLNLPVTMSRLMRTIFHNFIIFINLRVPPPV